MLDNILYLGCDCRDICLLVLLNNDVLNHSICFEAR